MSTRRGFLLALTGAGAGIALAEEATTQPLSLPLDWRFGRVDPPRASVSLPRGWFLTERLTDVGDPVQLFGISNRVIPAPHRNVAGTVNLKLVPVDAVLVLVVAFRIAPDMAVWTERSGSPPAQLGLASIGGGKSIINVPFRSYSWSHVGQTFGVQAFVWVGAQAAPEDVETLDAVLKSISFDEAL